jgi:hypothetical protein
MHDDGHSLRQGFCQSAATVMGQPYQDDKQQQQHGALRVCHSPPSLQLALTLGPISTSAVVRWLCEM